MPWKYATGLIISRPEILSVEESDVKALKKRENRQERILPPSPYTLNFV
jgi:hypothetical protein